MMDKKSKIYVAGHKGLVGSAIVRRLVSEGYINIITRTHSELDLTRQTEVEDFFKSERPEYVFLAASKVGGILANNTYPAEFIFINTMIQTNIIHCSYLYNVRKLLFLGSSCIYPRDCPQPMKEEYLLSDYLEKTNEPYAIAKILGIKMCQSYNRQYDTRFISVMPTNLYGPNDNFDIETSHVLPALLRKFHEAKLMMDERKETNVTIWGTGAPRREFLYVDDLADACLFLMNIYNKSEIINIGTGKDITVRDLAKMIRNVVGFKGEVVFDASMPDGTPRKMLDISKISELGWRSSGIDLLEGINKTYQWYLSSRTRRIENKPIHKL
jgi:GDP-L-fucose synthase